MNTLVNAQQKIRDGQYSDAIQSLQPWLEDNPNQSQAYWYLGLALLLSDDEDQAQMTWMFGLDLADEEQIPELTHDLAVVLETEAEQLKDGGKYAESWLVRQHLREIQPDLNNQLKILALEAHLQTLSSESIDQSELLAELKTEHIPDLNLLVIVTINVISHLFREPIALEFFRASAPHLIPLGTAFFQEFLGACMKISYTHKCAFISAQYAEVYLESHPIQEELLVHLTAFYQDAALYDKGIATAKRLVEAVSTKYLAQRISASHLLIRAYLSAGGLWEESLAVLETHKKLLASLTFDDLKDINPTYAVRLLTTTYYLPYFADNPSENKALQQHVNSLVQQRLESEYPKEVATFKQRISSRNREENRILKIGYISHCLNTHSVGWLARWIFEHHDHNQFKIYGYFLNYRADNFMQEWYDEHVDVSRRFSLENLTDSSEVADQISRDEIDILIDLDSITLDLTCEVLSLKPAPIQVTWLGWDASELPAIDYYIVDPYVLPEDAQSIYSEKLWRLPETYLAVDGFEVGVPSIHRRDFGIPADAVVYLTAQRGYKRHPETTRLQMRILKGVPNSYLLIKGLADEGSIRSFFETIALEEGVSPEQLIFLPQVSLEAVHRANLAVADIVLDTFPYNGATTTMETLWVGVPMVTMVGQQFAARNSYTMMMNAGITEGIAWNQEEYVAWGIRLGQEEELRKNISWKLKQSRNHAPLWNGKKFTREMENAYKQMWHDYVKFNKNNSASSE
jgi:predicted O-linked N-acetylglucosamine transferase (SPINDLY family)